MLRSALLAAAALMWSTVGFAQVSDDVAKSNALFDEGKRLLEAGQVAEACAHFTESNQLAPRAGTLLNLGLCHEQQGKLVAARGELQKALAMARHDGRAARVQVATEHLAIVEGKLSWVKITAPPNVSAERVEIRVDDEVIERRESASVPVEPGRHVVTASANGYRTRQTIVTIDKGTPQTSVAQFAPLEPIHTVERTPEESPHEVLPAADDGRLVRTTALIVGITGAVVSVVLGAWALDRKSVVASHCNASKVCDETGGAAASTGRTLVVASTIAFAVGAVGFGGWFVLPKNTSHATLPASAGLSMGGSF